MTVEKPKPKQWRDFFRQAFEKCSIINVMITRLVYFQTDMIIR